MFRSTPARLALFGGLCTLPSLQPVLRQREAPGGPGPLVWGLDVKGARYRDGVRDSPAAECGDHASLAELHDTQGVTLQVLQVRGGRAGGRASSCVPCMPCRAAGLLAC